MAGRESRRGDETASLVRYYIHSTADMSTPFKNAVDAFRDSPEWQTCTDPVSVGAKPNQRQYLENRALRAFEKGWDAGYDAARAEFSVNGRENAG